MQGNKPLAGKKIAIMVASGFIEQHMTTVQKALIAAGAQTSIVSPEIGVANGWHDEGWGHNFFVDEKINDVLPSQFDLLLTPGGERSTQTLMRNAHSKRVLKGMLEAGKPVALTDDASTLLVDAEVAKGRSLCAPQSAAEKLQEAGASLVDAPLHIDGQLITLMQTEATEDFITAIKGALGVETSPAEAGTSEAAA
jgi:protease I